MKINIGTKNPSKIDAVKDIINEYDFLTGAEVLDFDVESGTSDQPKSMEETIRGAKNRAKNSFKDCSLSFGIESGLFAVKETKSGYMDFCVCAIYDGENYHLGFSSCFEFPKKVIDLVFSKGINISEAFKELGLTDHEYIGHADGAIGILTKGKLTRKSYTKQAITNALIHLDNKGLY